MPFLVDGDNLLGTSGRKRTDSGRRRLAFELERLGRRLRRRMVVVFDGCRPDGGAPGGEVHFAGRSRSADDRILELLRAEPDPRGWIVVTSDRPLGDRCRHLGAKVERTHLFRGRFRDDDREKPDRETDVDFWLEQFEERDER